MVPRLQNFPETDPAKWQFFEAMCVINPNVELTVKVDV
jgi:hypothetical protein